jgi:hypothetical protein
MTALVFGGFYKDEKWQSVVMWKATEMEYQKTAHKSE